MENLKLLNGRHARIGTTTALYLLRFNVSLQIAIVAILVNLLLAICTFYYGHNSLYCAFGIDCVIGVTTSSILVWRFASSKQDKLLANHANQIYVLRSNFNNNNNNDNNHHHHTLETTAIEFTRSSTELVHCNQYDLFDLTIETDRPEDEDRESWSTFWLAQVMILSALGVIIRTAFEMADNQMNDCDCGEAITLKLDYSQMHPLYLLAIVSLSLNLVLMIFKIIVFYYLGSNSMLIEGINSFVSALFAGMAAVSIEYSEWVLHLDQLVSLGLGVFFLFYGVYNMSKTASHVISYFIKRNRPGYELIV